MPQPVLKLWIVEYRDVSDHDIRFSTRLRGYNREHIEERFYGAEDADGWEIVSIKPAATRR